MKKIIIFCSLLIITGCSTTSKTGDVNDMISGQPPASGNLFFGNEILHVSGGKNFKWKFECGGGVCAYGNFVNGEYWVAPYNEGEIVTILAVEPSGEENGLVMNPLAGNKQGFLSCQQSSYDVSKNLMTQLPFETNGDLSLVKADKREAECGSWGIDGCCIDSYDVLTVLDTVPTNSGVDLFRPGFAGMNKKLYSISDFDWSLLPELSEINETSRQSSFFDIEDRWVTPYYDHLSSELGIYSRAFVPQAVLPLFGAAMASDYLQDMLSVFGVETFEEKELATYALMQRGLDLYSSWKVGVKWPSGGGERVGRKPALAFLGALTTDLSIKNDISNMSKNNGNDTQEDGQIRVLETNLGGSGLPVWGDICSETRYWGQLFYEQQYAGATGTKIGSGDNKKTCRDPYGLIDGPAGVPGSGYMENGVLYGFAQAQKLMPALKVANNDPELLAFTNRVLSRGVQTLPDRCAPPDANESQQCKPHKAGAPGCLYYGVTWGPDPDNSGQCITNAVSGTTNGRFPHLDGASIGRLAYEPVISSKLNELGVIPELTEAETLVAAAPAVQDKKRIVPVERTVIEHLSGGTLFRWEFDCGTENCVKGQFVNGEYWVKSQTIGNPVVLISVTPEGEENGIEANPVKNTKQGFLSCQIDTYSDSLNLMNQLPYKVPPNTSLIKADKREAKCGTRSVLGCCIDAYDVVTIIDFVPENDGASVLRPGFAGKAKTYYSLSDFDWSNIPKERKISTSKGLRSYDDIVDTWTTPFFDHFMEVVGDRGRAYTPAAVMNDYGATHGANYLGALLSVFRDDPFDKKAAAVYALTQRGIDLYSSWKQGVRWPSGAGQKMGRKPPMAFFASVVNDESVKSNVEGMADNNGDDTQEDGQIRLVPVAQGGGGVPIWGDITGYCSENWYWQQLFSEKQYAGAVGNKLGSGDNKRTCGDPYGFIDGPAGIPGTRYMQCCSTGGFYAFVLAQKIMPALAIANNDPVLIEYVNRIKNEGIHTLPDECAPPDPRETAECKTYKPGALGCNYYKVTWGPDPTKPGQCIKNGADQNGRFPHLNGKMMKIPFNEPLISKILWPLYQ